MIENKMKVDCKMDITYSTYFSILAAPVLIFLVLNFIIEIRVLVHLIKSEHKNFAPVVIAVCMLTFTIVGFRHELVPTARLIADFGAETCETQGIVTSVTPDRSYEHNNYYGRNVTINSEQYYVFNNYPLRQGQNVVIEYLPHSHMIVHWERNDAAVE